MIQIYWFVIFHQGIYLCFFTCGIEAIEMLK